MAITVTTDTIVKIIVRNGSDSDRQNIILSQGELGYTNDTKRLFIGDGITAGGNPVGIKNFGSGTYTYPFSNVTSPQIGDIVFDNTSSTLYTYTTASTWTAISFNPNVQFDNSTIIKPVGSTTWQLNANYLSGGSISTLGAVSIINSLSAGINSTINLAMPANSVVGTVSATTLSGAQSIIVNPGQFIGNAVNGLSAISLVGVNGINTVAASNYQYNVDGAPLQNQINVLQLSAANTSSIISNFGTQFYKETSFTYSIDTYNGTAGISNMWQNVFVDPSCQPLRLSVTNSDPVRDRVLRVTGRLNFHTLYHYASIYARLATFSSATVTNQSMIGWLNANGSFPLLKPPYTAYTPSTQVTNVLDVATVSGPYNDWAIFPARLEAYYTVPAGSTVVFGLQTFIYSSGFEQKSGFVEINGWSTGNLNDNYSGRGVVRNQVGFTGSTKGGPPTNLPAYVGWYAWGQNPIIINGVAQYNGAPGSSVLYPQTQPGIDNGAANAPFADMQDITNPDGTVAQSKQWGVKNTSYISAVFLN